MAAIIEELAETIDMDHQETNATCGWKAVREYEVLARESQLDPFHAVGNVVAPNDKLALAYARAAYAEERWIDLAIALRAGTGEHAA